MTDTETRQLGANQFCGSCGAAVKSYWNACAACQAPVEVRPVGSYEPLAAEPAAPSRPGATATANLTPNGSSDSSTRPWPTRGGLSSLAAAPAWSDRLPPSPGAASPAAPAPSGPLSGRSWPDPAPAAPPAARASSSPAWADIAPARPGATTAPAYQSVPTAPAYQSAPTAPSAWSAAPASPGYGAPTGYAGPENYGSARSSGSDQTYVSPQQNWASTAQYPAAEPSPRRSRSSGPWMIIAIVLAVLLLGVGVFAGISAGTANSNKHDLRNSQALLRSTKASLDAANAALAQAQSQLNDSKATVTDQGDQIAAFKACIAAESAQDAAVQAQSQSQFDTTHAEVIRRCVPVGLT